MAANLPGVMVLTASGAGWPADPPQAGRAGGRQAGECEAQSSRFMSETRSQWDGFVSSAGDSATKAGFWLSLYQR